MPVSYVFGPVPSRRLGLSLGIDLIPFKTCTFDCLYCQVGKTTCKTVTPKAFAPVREVVDELKKKLATHSPDVITLAGSGEPTLHVDIDRVIKAVKQMTGKRIAVLTNGSLFWKDEIRHRVLGADIIVPTLTSAYEPTFRTIHRPHPELDLSKIMEGLKKLRKDYKGLLYLEVVLLAGLNDTEKEIEGLRALIEQIEPERIQLNTVVRPPADSSAIALDIKKMQEVMEIFGEKCEIMAESPVTVEKEGRSSLVFSLLEMVKRRPLKTDDIATALGLPIEQAADLVKGLLLKGQIYKREHSGDIYYLSRN